MCAATWLVPRYLRAYGPATPRHLARWLAIPPRYATELFGRLAGDLERVDFAAEEAWVAAGDTGTPAEPTIGPVTVGPHA